MNYWCSESVELGERLYEEYTLASKPLLARTAQDRSGLGTFAAFHRRFLTSWYMKIDLSEVPRLTQQETRDCYILMLKISDLWFSFEHLSKIAESDIKKKSGKSSVDLYDSATLASTGLDVVTEHFNSMLNTRVLYQSKWRQVIYKLLAYLKNNTVNHTQRTLGEIRDLIKDRKPLQTKHSFALVYGLRNLYVHKGVTASLGSKQYTVHRAFFMVLHDAVLLYSLALAGRFSRLMLAKSEAVSSGATDEAQYEQTEADLNAWPVD